MFRKITILLLLVCCCFYPVSLLAQKKIASVSGKVIDENDIPLTGAIIKVLNVDKNSLSNDSGYFKITITANKPVALIFSYAGYADVQKNFYLMAGEEEKITVKLQRYTKELQATCVL